MVRVARGFLAGAALAAAALLAGCQDGGGKGPAPDKPIDCAALSDSLFPAAQRDGVARFKVVRPDGGAFKVGSEMKVTISGVDYTSALVDLVVFGSGGGAARIPGFPATNGIKPRERCEFAFAVPESVTTLQGRRIPLVSDSVKVRIADYTDPLSYDYSDAFLSVSR